MGLILPHGKRWLGILCLREMKSLALAGHHLTICPYSFVYLLLASRSQSPNLNQDRVCKEEVMASEKVREKDLRGIVDHLNKEGIQ